MFGFDLNLFDNRVEFIFDTYFKNTDNLLMQASLPAYVSGIITPPWVNAGAMQNRGAEFTLNTVNISTKDFVWRSGLTISFNKNKITNLYTETSSMPGSLGRNADIDPLCCRTAGRAILRLQSHRHVQDGRRLLPKG